MANQATAVAYAALLLAGAQTPFTVENVEKLTKKAGVNVPSQLATQFVRAFEGKDIISLLSVGGGQGSAPAAQPAQAAAKPTEAPKAAEKPKDPEPEEDVDMGGLFD
ncbi:unnamed protein product (macronuclear) [Paramecium tetraurelia]|uniref:60S acidic ribosomal protein P2 n=1 Tax=Paramecium tetraurelia TaxID=5888 RepID=A0CXL4_PARTE|nr:uncharacterized protein GSPATT00011163001 [Paramecium tetraurelia]CAK75531.1 unnamed protein product [Paramecium tetraurelia]|eukprot:XP_001442928.1 hypothetical protein (macronuclear) [Paramecium tetraurelia strain d4-2]